MGAGLTVGKTFALIAQAVAVPGTAVPLTTSNINVRAFWVQAKRISGDNTGKIYIGTLDVDQDGANDAEELELNPGDYWEMPIPADVTINLSTVFIDAVTATDGVVGGYILA